MYKHKGVNGVLQSQKSLQRGLVGGKFDDPRTPPRNVNCCKPIRMRNYDVIFARTILIGRGELIAQKSYDVQTKRVFWLMIVQQWKKILTCSFFCWKDTLFNFVIQFKAWKLKFILTGSKVVTEGTSIFWTFCANLNEVIFLLNK